MHTWRFQQGRNINFLRRVSPLVDLSYIQSLSLSLNASSPVKTQRAARRLLMVRLIMHEIKYDLKKKTPSQEILHGERRLPLTHSLSPSHRPTHSAGDRQMMLLSRHLFLFCECSSELVFWSETERRRTGNNVIHIQICFNKYLQLRLHLSGLFHCI